MRLRPVRSASWARSGPGSRSLCCLLDQPGIGGSHGRRSLRLGSGAPERAIERRSVGSIAGLAATQRRAPVVPPHWSFLVKRETGVPLDGGPRSSAAPTYPGHSKMHHPRSTERPGGRAQGLPRELRASGRTQDPTNISYALNCMCCTAGWLEGGLVSCYEKFIVDVELLRELRHEFTPLEINEASLAFDAHTEVGPSGHFLGAAHTLERFPECFYRPPLSSADNFGWSQARRARHHHARGRDLSPDARGLSPAVARRCDPGRARGVRRAQARRARPLTIGLRPSRLRWRIGGRPRAGERAPRCRARAMWRPNREPRG
jgi:trimethylamine methyltransferase MttB